jgi:hypothetical protein
MEGLGPGSISGDTFAGRFEKRLFESAPIQLEPDSFRPIS